MINFAQEMVCENIWLTKKGTPNIDLDAQVHGAILLFSKQRLHVDIPGWCLSVSGPAGWVDGHLNWLLFMACLRSLGLMQ